MKYRHEYKYIIDELPKQLLLTRAEVLMERDSHSGENGRYYIRSLYFDDQSDTCLYDNLSGSDPREKFRIRYYNNDNSLIRLEKKSKMHGMTSKISVPITYEEYECLVNGSYERIKDSGDVIKASLFNEMHMRGMVPKVIVSYERIPFVCSAGNVRITFDGMISSSGELSRFLDGDYLERPVLELGQTVLEVKWDELIPDYIANSINTDDLVWTAYSKYSMCRLMEI